MIKDGDNDVFVIFLCETRTPRGAQMEGLEGRATEALPNLDRLKDLSAFVQVFFWVR